MPKIPDSYGIITAPSAKTDIAMPDTQSSQMLANLGNQLSGNLINIAGQMQYQSIKEDEAFNAAQVIDFKTKLATFENDKRIAISELPANDPLLFDKTKKTFQSERDSFINNYASQYKDNQRLSSLIKRQADVEAVDFNFDVDRTLSSKKREYGTNKIYEGIYSVNERLGKGGNPTKLSNELNTILQTGLKSGLIDQNDINRERDKQKSIIEELQKQYEKTRQANLVASGQAFIDPTNSDDKKIGDLAYQNIINNNRKQGIDPIVSTMSFIQKTGYVPSEVKGIWSTQLNVGNPQQKLETASNIANLIEANPRLQNQFSSDDINFAMEIKKRSASGLPAQQIIEYSEKEISKYQSMDRIAKMQVFNEKNSKKNIQQNFDDFIDENYKSYFSSNPAIEDGLKVTFEQIVKDQFTNNKNATLEGSVEFAKNVIKNEFAITDIGKKKVMRYAPETFYNKYNGGNTSWIKEQFAYKIVENKAINKIDDLDKDFSLVPHPNFIAGGKPSYFVAHKVGDSGQEEIMLGSNNRPIMFTPNIEEADFYKEQKKQYEKETKTPFTKQEALAILENRKSNQKTENIASTTPLTTAPITVQSIQKEAIKNTLPIIQEIKSIDENKSIPDIEKKVNKYLDKMNIYKEQLFGKNDVLPQDKAFKDTRLAKVFENNKDLVQNIKSGAKNMANNVNEFFNSVDTPLSQDKTFENTRFSKTLDNNIGTIQNISSNAKTVGNDINQFFNSVDTLLPQDKAFDKNKYINIFKNLQQTQDVLKTLTNKQSEIDKNVKWVENFQENPNNQEIKIAENKNEQIANWQKEYQKTKQDLATYNNQLLDEINKVGASFSGIYENIKERIINPKEAERKNKEIIYKEAEKYLKENPQIQKLGVKALNDLYEYGGEDSLSVKAYKKELEKIKENNPKTYIALFDTFQKHSNDAYAQKSYYASDKALKKLKSSDDYFAKGVTRKENYLEKRIQKLKENK